MKIKMTVPIVELDGDEMARVLWSWVKESLIEPFVDLKVEYYDLHIKNRDNTNDIVTIDAANAIKKYGVGVKCATITANKDRQDEYDLKEMWKSPNGTIRKILNGTVFRTPIILDTLTPIIPTWTKPITIARHSYGDIYISTSLEIGKDTKVDFVLTDKNGYETKYPVFDFNEEGILMGHINLDSSIKDFAHTCFKYALNSKTDLIFGTKDTVTKTYDYKFKDIFQNLYNNQYKASFEEEGISYTYTLIDDAISRAIKSNGGVIWACKNYEGDLMSDMVATGFGSLALMTSVLVSSDGNYEYEAAHGTVKSHYYRHLSGEKTSTNPIAIIFAWTGALRKRGELDANEDLVNFSNKLEEATINIVNKGIMTKDLIKMSSVENKKWVNSQKMIDSIAENLQSILL
ncbi:MAG: NADP-dependent isocitrate dehydrogenase [Tissierella sp.]|nr:NADP-dependent isocitrate dehydrogenase [Tissierella sp.]